MQHKRLTCTVIVGLMIVFTQACRSGCLLDPAPLEKNSQSLLFGISSYFRLSSFDGGFIGYQRFIGDNLALRISLGGSYEESDLEGFSLRGDAPDGIFDSNENYWSRTGMASLELVKHISQGRASIFFGGGTRLNTSAYRGVEEYSYQNNHDEIGLRRRYTERSSSMVSLSYILGMQWDLHGRFFLSAEYGGLFSVLGKAREIEEWGYENDPEDYSYTEREGLVRKFENLGVRFGLAAFF